MAWKKINTKRDFFKFENEGDALEGRWCGADNGKFGRIGTISTDDGKLSFSLNKALEDMETMEPGTMVRLEFTGWAESKAGQKFKTYDVMVDEEAPFEATEEEVPF